ncbi:MAG: hypothetical protein RSA57_07950 [Cetobacterium sp.]|uniref:YveK family protein n=1 Tax=Cetobacterium sp. TaxID=2071632 RepID=UPI002FCB5190
MEINDLRLIDIIFILKKRIKILLLAATPIFLLGIYLTLNTPTKYKGEVTFIIMNNATTLSSSINNNDLAASEKLATIYSEISKSKTLLQKIINKFDLNETVESLEKKVKFEPIGNTGILKLTYIDSHPIMAATISNEIGNEFLVKVNTTLNLKNIRIIEEAIPPTKPIPKKIFIKFCMVILASSLFGIFFAFLVENYSLKLKDYSEIMAILESPILGVIPKFEPEDKLS